MNKNIIIALVSVSTIQTAKPCAPTGKIDEVNVADCPVILDVDFLNNNYSSSVTNVNLTQGVINSSYTNLVNNITSNGVVTSNAAQSIDFNFTVASGSTIDLEAIQLLDYWSVEGGDAKAWDTFSIDMFIDGNLVATTANDISGTQGPFVGYLGDTNGNSNSYWEFAMDNNGINTQSNSSITAYGGEIVTFSIYTSQGVSTGADLLAIDGIQITGCVVPEPSAVLFIGFATLGVMLRRRR